MNLFTFQFLRKYPPSSLFFRLRTVPTTANNRHVKTQKLNYPTTHPVFIAPRHYCNLISPIPSCSSRPYNFITRFWPPRKYWKAFSTFFKKLVSDDLLGMTCNMSPWPACQALFYWWSLNNPPSSTFWVMVEKSILRSYSKDFWAPIGFWEKSIFFRNRCV